MYRSYKYREINKESREVEMGVIGVKEFNILRFLGEIWFGGFCLGSFFIFRWILGYMFLFFLLGFGGVGLGFDVFLGGGFVRRLVYL